MLASRGGTMQARPESRINLWIAAHTRAFGLPLCTSSYGEVAPACVHQWLTCKCNLQARQLLVRRSGSSCGHRNHGGLLLTPCYGQPYQRPLLCGPQAQQPHNDHSWQFRTYQKLAYSAITTCYRMYTPKGLTLVCYLSSCTTC